MTALPPRAAHPTALIAALACIGSLGLTPTAPAQFGRAAGFHEVTSPHFLSRDMRLFEESLGLDDGQSLILQNIFWDYNDVNEDATERMKQRFEDMQEELRELDRESILQLVFRPFEERAAAWDDANDQFLESVKTILNDEQLQRWPKFHRELRRVKQLPKGEFSGESVDLFRVLRELDFEEPIRTMARLLLEEYEIRLDDALQRRERLRRVFRSSPLMMVNLLRGDKSEDLLSNYERLIEARVAVRQVNDEYIEAITDALADPYAGTFRRAALERGYERVFRATPTERMFAAALELQDLTEETLEAVGQLQAAYLAELDVINASLLRLIRSYEPRAERDRAAGFALRESGRKVEKQPDPTREEFRNRDALGRRYAEQLKALLTPEQFQSLPGARRLSSGTVKSPKKKLPQLPRGAGVGTTPPDDYRRGGGGSKERGSRGGGANQGSRGPK